MAFLGDDDIFHELDVTSNNKVTNKTVKEKTKLYYENCTFIKASYWLAYNNPIYGMKAA